MKDSKLTFDDVNHQGSKALQTTADMVQQDLITKNTTYSAMVALFTAGRGVFMINGNWEVPTGTATAWFQDPTWAMPAVGR